jgi:orotate phosphoribosyltransferase
MSTEAETLEMMADAVVKRIPEGIDRIAGLELGSVPIAAVVSVKSKIPMIIVRKEKKEYGTGKRIEGDLEAGEKVLIIEDTTTTGGQIVKAINAIREAGGVVEKAIVVVNRGEGADEALEKEGVELISVVNASEILNDMDGTEGT